ncbi:MAG: hypothetical protein E6H69_12450 [Betaproteobacteria bacterium]|nr:MAG: hypothetical protein E6H69_12450 [Betaproteobacteria bacterium]
MQLAVPTRVLEWRAHTTDDLLCAGINSFGFGGTNAHAVLTSAPRSKRRGMASTIAPPYLWTVSARSKESLREAVTRDATFLRDAGKNLGELAVTVQRRRSHHPHRLVGASRTGPAIRTCARPSPVTHAKTPAMSYSSSRGRAGNGPAWAASCSNTCPSSGRQSSGSMP